MRKSIILCIVVGLLSVLATTTVNAQRPTAEQIIDQFSNMREVDELASYNISKYLNSAKEIRRICTTWGTKVGNGEFRLPVDTHMNLYSYADFTLKPGYTEYLIECHINPNDRYVAIYHNNIINFPVVCYYDFDSDIYRAEDDFDINFFCNTVGKSINTEVE